jgi:biotin transport system permease protein
VLVPLLVKTLRTADALADAIDARCFDPEEPS